MSSPWHDRWAAGTLGWHRDTPHPLLLTHAPRFLAQGPHRVLMPLAGKSEDIAWLIDQGHEVVAVELVPAALDQFHAQHGRTPAVAQAGALVAHTSPGLLFLQGDVMALEAQHLHGVTRVWDRAAMVALPAPVRSAYVALLRRLLPSGSQVMLSTFSYPQAQMPGPPFSVDDAEVAQAYAGAQAETLYRQDEIDDPGFSKFRERGLEGFVQTLRLITL